LKPLKTLDSIEAFETALAAEADSAHYRLRLFVTGATPQCLRAIKNIRAICEANLFGRYELEVVDIYQHPEQAKPEAIVVTPTLVKQLPLPSRKIIGDLSDNQRVLVGLDIFRHPSQNEAIEDNHGS